ncbi:reverse transcriptase domain-containing protein [Tanacetum coccineum]
MSRSSSSHTAHDASESGHTASLSKQPIQYSEEDPSEDEVNSIHSPTPTPTLVPSPPTHQGPRFRQTARMRVISPTRVIFRSRPHETPAREVSPHPSLTSTYHIGGPSSTDPYVTAWASDMYSWEHLIDHPRHPTGPRLDISMYPHMVTGVSMSHKSGMTLEELNRMQYLCGEVRECRIGVECQPKLLLEMSDIVERLTHQALNANRGNPRGNPTNSNQGCSYKTFMSCNPKEFYENEGVVGLLSWIEGMESKLHISKCSDNNKVEYAACLLQGRALTWWNTQVQTRGREAALRLTWEEFKNLLLKEYCPKSEVQKLELEFWNHTMDKRIDHYIWGLAPEIRGMVTSANPSTIQSAVVLANHLTNDAIRSRVWKKDNVGNKRREENQSRNQGGGNQDKR